MAPAMSVVPVEAVPHGSQAIACLLHVSTDTITSPLESESNASASTATISAPVGSVNGTCRVDPAEQALCTPTDCTTAAVSGSGTAATARNAKANSTAVPAPRGVGEPASCAHAPATIPSHAAAHSKPNTTAVLAL